MNLSVSNVKQIKNQFHSEQQFTRLQCEPSPLGLQSDKGGMGWGGSYKYLIRPLGAYGSTS